MASERPSEDDLIQRYFAPLAGPGGLGLLDDAALVSPPAGHDLVLTKDALVAGVHFFGDDAPEAIARKSLRVNLSDLAAKGAEPLGFLLALSLPADWSADWLALFAQGLGEDIAAFRFPLLGGDTTRTPGPLCISVTAVGLVPSGDMVLRTGVEAGDALYVSGTIGDAALGLQLRQGPDWGERLHEDARGFLMDRYLIPQPRIALRKVLRAYANGAMDVSDGLIGDLTKMLRVSGVSAQVQLENVPLSLAARDVLKLAPSLFNTTLCGGDDYEILCSVSPKDCAAFEAGAGAAGIAVARIGEAVAGQGAPQFFDARGQRVTFAKGSFSHF